MVTYHPMDKNELEHLQDFAAPIWRECYHGVLPEGQIELLIHKYFDFEHIKAFQAQGMYYDYVMFDGQPAGFIAYELHDTYVYLDKLYLKSTYRGKHISSAVFKDLITRYQKPIRLNVNQDNHLGMRAYQGNGFEIIEAKEYPLPGGFVNRDYIMEKPLPPMT